MARGDAGFKYTDPDSGSEVTVRLQGELRDVSASERRLRFTRESLDGTEWDVVTVGQRLPQVSATARYQSHVKAFAAMLEHGLNKVTLNYYPSLASTVTPIPCKLMSVNGATDVSFGPDPDTWFRGEHTTDLVLRRVDGDTFDELLNPIVLRYYPGADLIAHSRASAATYIDSGETIRTVASNVLRDDHYIDDVRHTLLEPGRTNLLLYSEQFDNAAWTKSNTTISVVNSAGGRDGTVTADTLAEDTSTSVHSISQSVSKSGSALNYAWSIWVKPNGRNYVELRVSDGAGNYPWAVFNISTGVVHNSGVVGSGVTLLSAEIEEWPSGWYRCRLAFTSNAATTVYPSLALSTDGTQNDSYTGGGGAGVYLWGAQFEQGGFTGSYLKTEASTVARAVDVASIALPSAIQSPSTAWARYTRWRAGMNGNGSISAPHVWQIGDGGSSRVTVYWASSTQLRLRHSNASAHDDATVTVNVSRGDTVEAAVTWNGDGTGTLAVSVNGGTIASATLSGITPPSAWSSTTTYLNSRDSGSNAGAMALRDDKVAYRGGRRPYEGLTASALLAKLRSA